MLAEPSQGKVSSHVHQFVIASHTLTTRISALSPNDLQNIPPDLLTAGQKNVTQMLTDCVENLNAGDNNSGIEGDIPPPFHSANAISIIYSLSHDFAISRGKLATQKNEGLKALLVFLLPSTLVDGAPLFRHVYVPMCLHFPILSEPFYVSAT